MTAKNGNPCARCGANEWYRSGNCKVCSGESVRRWVQNHPEKYAENNSRYRQRNPDKEADRVRRWVQANKEKDNAKHNRRRTRKTEAGGSYTAEEFKALCNHYGNACLRCGRDDVKLTADHILPVSRGGSSNIGNIQPLCGKCNSAKCDRHIDYRPDAGPLRWLQCKLFG